MEARRLWQEVDQEVQGRTGYTQGGVHYLASSEKELENLVPVSIYFSSFAGLKQCHCCFSLFTFFQWLEIAAQHGLDSRLLSAKETSGLIRQGDSSKHRWIASLYTPSDGRGEPWAAVPAVAELARSEGVIIREDCAVRTLDIQGGQVAGVVTESGTTKSSQVVLAGGAWSSLFAKRHGIDIPQLLVRGTVARTVQLPEVLTGNAIDEELAFRRRQDGRYSLAGHNTFHFLGPDSFRHLFQYLPLLKSFPDISLRPSSFMTPDSWNINRTWNENDESPFESIRVLDPPPDLATVHKLESLFKIRFPDFNSTIIENSWGGMIDTMPDIVPVVDRVPTLKGKITSSSMVVIGDCSNSLKNNMNNKIKT